MVNWYFLSSNLYHLPIILDELINFLFFSSDLSRVLMINFLLANSSGSPRVFNELALVTLWLFIKSFQMGKFGVSRCKKNYISMLFLEHTLFTNFMDFSIIGWSLDTCVLLFRIFNLSKLNDHHNWSTCTFIAVSFAHPLDRKTSDFIHFDFCDYEEFIFLIIENTRNALKVQWVSLLYYLTNDQILNPRNKIYLPRNFLNKCL